MVKHLTANVLRITVLIWTKPVDGLNTIYDQNVYQRLKECGNNLLVFLQKNNMTGMYLKSQLAVGWSLNVFQTIIFSYEIKIYLWEIAYKMASVSIHLCENIEQERLHIKV